MAYAPTDWVDNATPVDAAHLDNIEQGIVALDTGKVDRDATVAAAARLVASKLVAGDANPAFRVLGDGTMLWGSGGAAIQDVQLSRRANDGQMRLTGTPSLYVEHGFVAGQGITSFAGTAQQVDIGFVLTQPGFNFGFPSDTNLYRAGVNQLKTDGDLSAVGLLRASRGGGVDEVVVGTSGIGFGGDTTLARAGVNSLRTPGNFTAALDLLARGAAATQSWIGDAGGGKAGIVLGSAQDVKLYRNGVGVLRTDGTLDANALTINGVPVGTGGATDITGKVDKDSVVVAATRVIASKLLAGDAQPAFFLGGDGKIQWGAGGAAALDTYLYRTAPGQLKTDGTLRVTQGISANYGSSSQIHLDPTGKLYFGNALDTYLYRSAANVLKTDGSLIAAGNISSLLASGDTQPQIVLSRNFAGTGLPGIAFGPGGATGTDTNLYRSAAGVLATGSAFMVQPGTVHELNLGWGGFARSGIYFSNDTTLYSSAANELTTAGFLYANGGLGAKSGSLYLQSDGGKIFLGTASDVNLYRNSAGVLKTDGRFIAADAAYAFLANPAAVGGYAFASFIGAEGSARFLIVAADGRLQWGPGGAAAQDTNLYRSAAAQLKTDGTVYVAGNGGSANLSGIIIAPTATGPKWIEVGGPDSAGAGYRSLRVSN